MNGHQYFLGLRNFPNRDRNPQAHVGENPPQGQHPPFPGYPAGGSRVRDGSDYGDSTGRRDKDRDRNPVVTLAGIRGASAGRNLF